MKHGFLKVAAVTPKIKVADPQYNAANICQDMRLAYEHGAKLIVFPELCLSGCTCGDLFRQQILLCQVEKQLCRVAAETEGMDAVTVIGIPYECAGKLYNVAAVLQNGRILGLVPKGQKVGDTAGGYFAAGEKEIRYCMIGGEKVLFGTGLLFGCDSMKEFKLACEIGEELYAPISQSTKSALAGATVIAGLSAAGEIVGTAPCRELMVKSTSARLNCGYVMSSAGAGESTQDMVFGGHNLVAENGTILEQRRTFDSHILYADLDLQKIQAERLKRAEWENNSNGYLEIPFHLQEEDTVLERKFSSLPFVPEKEEEREMRCEEILTIQSYGLKKRYEHIGCKTAVLGISGGLDSTLALLVTVRAFDLLGLDRKGIYAVTMPCFGTTDRTYENACQLAQTLGTTLKEVDIRQAVTVHFEDIGHDPAQHDVTYENAQARERTQVLMDIANQVGGLVIGTGDLSELALGWATYNGDHMSMYGVNAGVPKTLLRYLVGYYAQTCGQETLKKVLLDVLDTPVSPELLPPVDGMIAQKTEDLVGPYELHDFFLYYFMRHGFAPDKIFRLAQHTFRGIYEDDVIKKWLKTFCRRFFQQQFKRSCLPDGPKVGSVSVSPRGAWKMASDASASLWLQQAENL